MNASSKRIRERNFRARSPKSGNRDTREVRFHTPEDLLLFYFEDKKAVPVEVRSQARHGIQNPQSFQFQSSSPARPILRRIRRAISRHKVYHIDKKNAREAMIKSTSPIAGRFWSMDKRKKMLPGACPAIDPEVSKLSASAIRPAAAIDYAKEKR